jgi:protoporphyrinogen oxidase
MFGEYGDRLLGVGPCVGFRLCRHAAAGYRRSVGDASRRPVVILGAGLTGLSAALHLVENGERRPICVVERDERVGGKATSERQAGHTFDVTGHWLHLRDDRVRALLDRLFQPGDLVEIERRTGIYTHGVMLPYPFQANLFGLPLEVVRECLVEFLAAQVRAASPDAPEPRTFEEFAVARFGAGIARHFFIPYNRKLWGEHYDALTPAWVSRFVPLPDASQVIGGAIGLRQEGLGYNARFSYPRRGGIDALPEALAASIRDQGVDLRLGVAAQRVDLDARAVTLGDGNSISFDRLVSTIPLPELVDAATPVPPEVTAARGRLRWVRWRWLDLATRTRPPIDEHWVYVPEPDIPFFRVGVFSNALAAMAPRGAGSLYVELTDRDAPPDLPRILRELARIGAIASVEDVLFAHQRDIEYAYVVFDHAYDEATSTVHGWLEEVGVRSCGRYGAWVYNSMEDSIIAGMEAAAWAMG